MQSVFDTDFGHFVTGFGDRTVGDEPSLNDPFGQYAGCPKRLIDPDINILHRVMSFQKLETDGDYTARLALLEEQKCLPWHAVWDRYCQCHDVPVGAQWLDNVRHYEKTELAKR